MADRKTVIINSITSKSQGVHSLVREVCICRVPRRLRKVNEEAYTPQIVSIGPYHHGNKILKPMEEHKLRYFTDLFHRGSKNSEEVFVEKLIELEDEARKFYEPPIMEGSNSFVEMMLLDGCFIIELIIKQFEGKGDVVRRDPLFCDEVALSSIKYDMLLLENQLPFFVLECLLILFTGSSHRNMVEDFLEKVFNFFNFKDQIGIAQDVPRIKVNNEKTKHFLDLCRDFCVPLQEPVRGTVTRTRAMPCATELKNRGIKFKGGKISQISTIRFAENGVFVIPTMNVHEHTEVLLRNLIAYEQCFVKYENKYVTYYVHLMDLLINSPADVASLGRSGVIDNYLDNEQVSHIFNNISKGTIIDGFSFSYPVFCDVNSYYRIRWNKFRSMLLREYFYSPWSTASSIAVMIVVLCTITQTICSVMSAVKGA